jgi:hypothetical protein
MKAGKAINLLLSFLLLLNTISAQENNPFFAAINKPLPVSLALTKESDIYIKAARKRAANATGTINLYIFNKEKKFNLSSFGFRLNTRLAKLFHNKIKIVKVESLADLAVKVNSLMEVNQDKMIRHLWFDSHGKYRTGFSMFNIGCDTLTIKNILEPAFTAKMEQLTAYCDENSQITIGACYAAATYKRPANKYLEEQNMYGDSLLIAMSSIFRLSPVYGTESWVMVKPLLFGKQWGIAGYPIDLKYMDEIYRPVWERIGTWKKVAAGEGFITQVHTPFISKDGELQFNEKDYLTVKKHKKRQLRKLKKLKPGVYKFNPIG